MGKDAPLIQQGYRFALAPTPANALQNFSKGRRSGRRVGFPRFRSKGRCRESVIFQRPRITDTRHVVLDGRLGALRTKESMRKLRRLLERERRARILRSTVQRSGRGWSISFTVERLPKRRRARRPRAVVGVDLGLTRLATLSTRQTMANSRPLQKRLSKLRCLQRQLDRQRRASNPGNYLSDGRIRPGPKPWVKSKRALRTEQRIQQLHGRVADLRREQAHQLTTHLTSEYGVIGVEALAVKNLSTNRRLARQISDVGWGQIIRQLAYKTAWSQGSKLVTADRLYPSSRTCSACGAVKVKLFLAERVFECDACGHEQDRDLNAALNLAQLAERQAGSETADVYVARTGRETLNARGGQVSPGSWLGLSPLKREASLEASQRREALALVNR